MYKEITFNSKDETDFFKLEAPYFNAIEPTKITFVNEKVVATINSLGHIEIYDLNGNTLSFIDLPVSDDPSEKGHSAQYGNAQFAVKDKEIIFRLPSYYWEDNYPHCDGEFDRWERGILNWFDVVFDCTTRQIYAKNNIVSKERKL